MRSQDQLIRAACSLLFCLFTFFYIFSYQADLIGYAQMVLSEGKTHFNRTVGALLITAALYVIHIFVYGLMRPHSRYVALSYFPSLLLLTVITDIPDDIAEQFSFGAWLWVLPLFLVLFVALAAFLRQWSAQWQTAPSSFFHDAWVNLAIMASMFFFMGWVSNGNELFHRQLGMEKLIISGKYDKALDVDAETGKRQKDITRLAAFALAQQKALGERFFEYPVADGDKGLPSHFYLVPPQVIDMAENDGMLTDDYELTSLLRQRRLNDFARKVRQCYTDSTMPKHYREAMAIFRQTDGARLLAQEEEARIKAEQEKAKKEKRLRRSSKKAVKKAPAIHPLDSVVSSQYASYRLLLQCSADQRIVYNLSRKYFANTYFHYYHFKN